MTTAVTTKERPIIFSEPMIDALLAGKKTQTRRIVKNHGKYENMRNCAFCCPYGVKGDVLWVRETFIPRVCGPIYRADYSSTEAAGLAGLYSDKGWTSPIYMPRAASRIDLKIVDVNVQKLHEISSNDALAEGISLTEFWTPTEMDSRPFEEKWWDDFTFWAQYPRYVFEKLWNDIHGKRAWDDNPWIWKITFERMT